MFFPSLSLNLPKPSDTSCWWGVCDCGTINNALSFVSILNVYSVCSVYPVPWGPSSI